MHPASPPAAGGRVGAPAAGGGGARGASDGALVKCAAILGAHDGTAEPLAVARKTSKGGWWGKTSSHITMRLHVCVDGTMNCIEQGL
eukprot:gene28093-27979_t